MSSSCKLVARQECPGGSTVRIGDVEVGGREFVVAAGPCAVESHEQMMEAAEGVAAGGARVLRAGAFKPRTSPYSFQGLGEEGLRLLSLAGKATGLPVVTEILATEDLSVVARYSDALQVGARNMQNFSLLKALGSIDKPVILKRGLSATIDELLLAAEYIVVHGNPRVILCERGIRTFETSTRNTLDLNGVAVLKQLTHLPVIVDPSHATGRRDLIAPMSRAAAALGADGLLIEVHPDPDHALSDGPQSITPSAFADLMCELAAIVPLQGRHLVSAGDLESHRSRIDSIDQALVRLLCERAHIATRIGEIKERNNMPIRCRQREDEVLARAVAQSDGALSSAALRRLFTAIIAETRSLEILEVTHAR
jgi:3-deoxy-7-phosphoheptulonate synthase